jgi:hypothetical protein
MPLMDIASAMIWTSANIVGPIAGGNYAQTRSQERRGQHEKRLGQQQSLRTPVFTMVNKF